MKAKVILIATNACKYGAPVEKASTCRTIENRVHIGNDTSAIVRGIDAKEVSVVTAFTGKGHPNFTETCALLTFDDFTTALSRLERSVYAEYVQGASIEEIAHTHCIHQWQVRAILNMPMYRH